VQPAPCKILDAAACRRRVLTLLLSWPKILAMSRGTLGGVNFRRNAIIAGILLASCVLLLLLLRSMLIPALFLAGAALYVAVWQGTALARQEDIRRVIDVRRKTALQKATEAGHDSVRELLLRPARANECEPFDKELDQCFCRQLPSYSFSAAVDVRDGLSDCDWRMPWRA
jgi:hypothetical protein